MSTYVWDLDGTLCTKVDGDPPDYALAMPIRSRIEDVNRLHDQGHTILILTSRGGTTGIDWRGVTEAQLEAWGVKYHELQINTKPYYDFWVHDKAMSVEDWDRRHASMKVDELSEYDDVVGDPDAV